MTLQKEFYANFIVQRLTLKVINMDTLYLVFKDRFPIQRIKLSCSPDSFGCQSTRNSFRSLLALPYRRQSLASSKKAYYLNALSLSSTISSFLQIIFRDETA